jgi:hypothetical protein
MTSVFQSQYEHYSAVRQRLLYGLRVSPRREVLPNPVEPAPVAPVPVPAPKARVRDWLFVASRKFSETPSPQIIREVCAKHSVTPAELIGKQRFPNIVRARQEAAYRMSKETTLSLPQIGRKLGNKDHTTIIYSIRCHAARLEGREYRKPRYETANG